MTTRKFFKTTYTVTVLSEDTQFNTLEEAVRDMNYGGSFGRVTSTCVPLTPKEVATEINNSGGETDFFDMDINGVDWDESEDGLRMDEIDDANQHSITHKAN